MERKPYTKVCECCGTRAEQIPAPDRGEGHYECSECGCIYDHREMLPPSDSVVDEEARAMWNVDDDTE